MLTCAVLGATAAPGDFTALATRIGHHLSRLGYRLAVDHQNRLCQAFSRGMGDLGGVLPPSPPVGRHGCDEDGLAARADAVRLLDDVRPGWELLPGQAPSRLLAAAYQVRGLDLESPVDFVLCLTGEGLVEEPSDVAMRIAQRHGIPVYDIAAFEGRRAFRRQVGLDQGGLDLELAPGVLVWSESKDPGRGVYVARAFAGRAESPLHNPFPLAQEGDRGAVLTDHFGHYLSNDGLIRAAHALCGVDLSCWCAERGALPLDAPLRCHAQTIGRAARGDYDGAELEYRDLVRERRRNPSSLAYDDGTPVATSEIHRLAPRRDLEMELDLWG